MGDSITIICFYIQSTETKRSFFAIRHSIQLIHNTGWSSFTFKKLANNIGTIEADSGKKLPPLILSIMLIIVAFHLILVSEF